MRGFRAKDEDRDRFVELIEAAYVDGQLGAEDRELRVARALSAETLDELQTLTRDLQPPPGHGVVPSSPTRPAARPRRLAGALVALGALVAVLGVGVGSLVLFASSDTDSATSTVESPAVSAPDVEEPVTEEEPAVRPFEMTAPHVRKFLRGYEAKFGTLDAFSTVFYPTRVSMEVPVRGSRPRAERWSYDGTWRRDSEASAVSGPGGIVDLGVIEVDRLFANIAKAKKVLRVQRGALTHVGVRNWDGVLTVNIYVGNRFNESGYLMTTSSGEEIRRFPYDS